MRRSHCKKSEVSTLAPILSSKRVPNRMCEQGMKAWYYMHSATLKAPRRLPRWPTDVEWNPVSVPADGGAGIPRRRIR